MTLATHVLTATALCTGIKCPKYAIPVIALTSHYLLDAIPHYEIGLKWNAVLFILGLIYLGFIGIRNKIFGVIIAVIFASFPDINILIDYYHVMYDINHFFHFNNSVFITHLIMLNEDILVFCSTLLLARNKLVQVNRKA